jgi:hypothetical protein
VPRNPNEYDALFDQAGREHNVDPRLLKSVALTESGLNPFTSDSNKGAKGMMQFIGPTAQHFGIDPYDPAQAINAAARYLSEALDRKGSVSGALGEYYGKVDPGYIGKVVQYYGDRRSEISISDNQKSNSDNSENALLSMAGAKSGGNVGDILDDFVSGKLDAQLSGKGGKAASPPAQIAKDLPAGSVQQTLSPIDQRAIEAGIGTLHDHYNTYSELRRSNINLEANLRNAAEAFKDFKSGAGTTLTTNIGRLMTAGGIDPSKFGLSDPASVQAARKSAAQALFALMESNKGNKLVAEYSTAQHAIPDPDLEPEAAKDIIAGALARIKAQNGIFRKMDQYRRDHGESVRGLPLSDMLDEAAEKMPDFQKEAYDSLPKFPGQTGKPALQMPAAPDQMVAPAAPGATAATPGSKPTPAPRSRYNPEKGILEPMQ